MESNSNYKCISHRLVAKIVSALLPKYPVIKSDERKKIEEDVIDFVYGQIEALPVYLQIAYKIILYKFNFYSLFLYGNIFSNLSESKKINYLKLWSESPIRQMRDFIKLIKSCTFLQYYDHPVILETMIVQNEKNEKQLQARKN